MLVCHPGFSFKESMWHDIASALNHCMQEKSVILGWSMGGLLALEAYLKEPERYSHLILINSTPYFDQFSELYWDMASQDLLAFQKQFLRWVCYPKSPERIKAIVDDFIWSDEDTEKQLFEQLHYLFHTDWREVYSKIHVPVLRIQGKYDSIVKTPFYCYQPQEKIQILNGGHALPFTHREAMMKLISDFVCQ